jgi:hypothetical protein
MSKKARAWELFSDDVLEHIEEYVVPQYGDLDEDLCSEYTVEECILNMKRYLQRIGRNSRPGHDALDCIKIAHYAQMIYDKLENKDA